VIWASSISAPIQIDCLDSWAGEGASRALHRKRQIKKEQFNVPIKRLAETSASDHITSYLFSTCVSGLESGWG
jgi:hypothetical protein